MKRLDKFDSGIFTKGAGYNYFLPNEVNTAWRWEDPELNMLMQAASIKIGELNSYSKLVPNIDVFIHLHVTKEAVVSSKIEGTQTQIDEALMNEEDIPSEKRHDWFEVVNYTKALTAAIADLRRLPISTRLIKKTHRLLLEGVRGAHKNPGEYRRSQNWIGGASIKKAAFVPPAHTHINELMSDLEKFIHNDAIRVPALIRIGMAHYQFETIHPFLDGNGRIGRLMITLFFISEGIMNRPLLYLSAYFEKYRREYYDRLMAVREKNDMIGWLKFFLTGLEETASQAVATLSSVIELKNDLEDQVKAKWGRRTASAQDLLLSLFHQPVIKVHNVQEVCGLSPKAANDLVSSFEAADILVEKSGQSRNRIFSFDRYISLFKDE